MKKIIVTAALAVMFVSAGFAQGTLNFSSAGAGVVFRTTNPVGVLCSGSAYLADLYYGAAGSTEAQLTPIGIPATYNTGAQAGFFTGGARTIPGFAGGTVITAQVRVWESAYGSTFETAIGSHTDKSVLFNVTLATPPATPVNMTALNGQNLTLFIPEPTTFAVTGLGLASLMIFKRRK